MYSEKTFLNEVLIGLEFYDFKFDVKCCQFMVTIPGHSYVGSRYKENSKLCT